jgi:alkylation response protein AidB-like acyl-CoA dehydrogenase
VSEANLDRSLGTPLTSVLERVDGIADTIRAGARESEQLGRLSSAVFEALHDADLFRILIPRDLGGCGLTIPESIQVFERVASFDASTAWTLAILADGALLARFVSSEVFTRICTEPVGLISGSLNPVTARAERTEDGYLFSGKATYLSGSAHAQWIMASAIVTKDQRPALQDGRVEIRAGLFPIDRARSLDTWHVTGMRATGSTDYAFEDVLVAPDWTFEPLSTRAGSDDVLDVIPLWAQLGGGLASCAVGTARNMIDRFVELAAFKVPVGGNPARLGERPTAHIAVGEAEGFYQAAHAVLTDAVACVWSRGVAREPFDNSALARQRLGTITAVRLATLAIDRLHDAAGMSAVASDTVLERCWRDVHTMTQHAVLSPAKFEVAGRVLCGLDPGSPVI